MLASAFLVVAAYAEYVLQLPHYRRGSSRRPATRSSTCSPPWSPHPWLIQATGCAGGRWRRRRQQARARACHGGSLLVDLPCRAVNTRPVAGVHRARDRGGLVLALLGAGKSRILHGFTRLYIWMFRNIPIIVQVFFWYHVTRQLPPVRQALEFFGCCYASNRGIYIPHVGIDARRSRSRRCLSPPRLRRAPSRGESPARARDERLFRAQRRSPLRLPSPPPSPQPHALRHHDAAPAGLQLCRRNASVPGIHGARGGHRRVQHRVRRGDRQLGNPLGSRNSSRRRASSASPTSARSGGSPSRKRCGSRSRR